MRAILGVFLLTAGNPLVALPAPAAAVSDPATLVWGELRVESPVSLRELGWDGDLGLRGRRLDDAPLDPAVGNLLRVLADAGYAFARVIPGGFDAAGDTVTGVLRVQPGTRPRLGGVVLAGAGVTRPEAVLRLAGLRRGDLYTGRERERTRERLLRSGLFTAVDPVGLAAGEDPDEVYLEVRLREPAYTRFTGILGVAGREAEVTGLVDLELLNLAGTARTAAGRWEGRGDGLTRFALRYREPWLPWVPIGLTGSLNHDINEAVYSFTKWEVSGDIGFSSGIRVQAGYGAAHAVESEIEKTSDESYVLAGIAIDRRNSALVPTAGYRASLESRRGDKEFVDPGGELRRFDRTRWDVAGEVYRGLGGRWLGAGRFTFTYLDTDEDPLPRYDLIPVGGAVSLRGYREEQFLTSTAAVAQFEARFRQDERGSALYGFFDSGWIASDLSLARRDDPDRWVFGYGLGVRQASTVGVLGVEYGIARGENPLDGRIHLRIDAVF
jgi:outer membrane protein assembly factor BamA